MQRSSRAIVAMVAIAGCDVDVNHSTLPAELRAVSERMHLRFAAVERIERGIVTSRLGEVHHAASTIATLDDPEALPAWQPYLAGVKRAATDLTAADDVAEAAHHEAELGRQCARCHIATGTQLAFRDRPHPDAGVHIQHTMAGHQWGVARMWEGLIGPNEERWLSGARVLQRAPLMYIANGESLAISDDVLIVRMISSRAVLVRSSQERAALFGRLLGTCARCHATVRERHRGAK
jgi:cytochrome c553